MKFVQQDFVEIQQKSGFTGMYQMIEQAGRTSYQSEDSITEDSAEKFVKGMLDRKHHATLEFATLYLLIPTSIAVEEYENGKVLDWVNFFEKNPYSRVFSTSNNIYITTNYRVIVENNLNDVIEFMAPGNEPSKFHKKRYCIKITTCRQVTHESVRHRVMSFLQESTRYCLYAKGKFDNELKFVDLDFLKKPEFNVVQQDNRNWFRKIWDKFRFWLADVPDLYAMTPAELFIETLQHIENNYLRLAEMKKEVNGKQVQLVPTQFLALLLPNDLKADLCICAFADEWQMFFDLRTTYIKSTGAPHPFMGAIADRIYDYFIDNKYIKLDK